MGWTRHTGTVVSFACLASIVANYAVHRHFERRMQERPVAVARPHQMPPGSLVFKGPLPVDPIVDVDAIPASAIPRVLEEFEHSSPLGAVTPALQTSESTELEKSPSPVPLPNDGVPIGEQTPTDAEAPETPDSHAVRIVIDEELSGSSREERDIWYDELKSLPAGVVRDLLQVRKQLRALPRALHTMDPIEPVPAPRVAELNAEPASQTRRQTLPDWVPATSALEQASSIARHNLANSTTPGFKRLRVILVDSYSSSWRTESDAEAAADAASPLPPLQVEGCRLIEPQLDLKPGTLHQTDRRLDLAIDGEGFFVAIWKENPVYTRCGAMVLDAQRRICLAVAEGSAPLQPVIAIPSDAREIQITATGNVMVLRARGADPESVGQIHLAQFPSPTRLRPAGGTLLVATEASGAAELGAADVEGRGVIQQGCLEQSNVEVEEELADIEQWQSLLKSFPSVSRPVTASGPEPRSR
jgi:flagellar basal-body rod protein FlgG